MAQWIGAHNDTISSRPAVMPRHDSRAASVAMIWPAPGDGTVTVEGDLDVTTLPLLSWHLARIVEHSPRELVLDLTGVSYLDCAATHAILKAARALPGRPRPALLGPSPAVSRLLSLTGLDSAFDIRS